MAEGAGQKADGGSGRPKPQAFNCTSRVLSARELTRCVSGIPMEGVPLYPDRSFLIFVNN